MIDAKLIKSFYNLNFEKIILRKKMILYAILLEQKIIWIINPIIQRSCVFGMNLWNQII